MNIVIFYKITYTNIECAHHSALSFTFVHFVSHHATLRTSLNLGRMFNFLAQ